MYKLKRDKYVKSRGGYSRLLDIACVNCNQHICFYQKDGPGLLKRMYLDRIIYLKTESKIIKCTNCGLTLGNKIVYEKENN